MEGEKNGQDSLSTLADSTCIIKREKTPNNNLPLERAWCPQGAVFERNQKYLQFDSRENNGPFAVMPEPLERREVLYQLAGTKEVGLQWDWITTTI